IDGREDALVDKLTLEDDFAVARAFEFFKDHVIHSGTGVDQGGGDDGQRAAFLNVAGGAAETLRTLQGVGVHAAGEHFAGRRNDCVVGASKTGDGVDQYHDVALMFDQSLGFFDHHFSDLDVTCRGLVEGRGNYFAFDGALHVGDFFRTLVDQQHHQNDF